MQFLLSIKIKPSLKAIMGLKLITPVTWRITFTHKGLFGSQTKCFMANPILSDYSDYNNFTFIGDTL